MKQILQSLKDGRTEIVDIPMPQIKAQHVLIKTHCSLISPGTEKMLVAFGEATMLEKALKQPDKVRMVINKVKTDGLLPTIAAVRHKLDQLIPMGYSNVGTVVAVGQGVTEFALGDRVVSNGAHAEIVSVPKNLCCKIPEDVSDDAAVFSILGAIALQSMRLSQPQMGESFAVIGLGLIGLLTTQLLRAQGCRILGIDLDEEKTQLAKTLGADVVKLTSHTQVLSEALQFSRGRGVDGVIITCATKSNVPIQQAAQMCRKRGRITLVGVTGLQLSRADFYEKELRFQVSCAYGPGRYDQHYEHEGQDYPLPYVRFTAQRNFETFLDLLAMRAIDVQSLITHRYTIDKAEVAYASLTQEKNIIGILLDYPRKHHEVFGRNVTLKPVLEDKARQTSREGTCVNARDPVQVKIGFIGAGNYASRVLIPAFKNSTACSQLIACESGISGVQTARRLNIAKVTTDTQELLQNPDINTVVIATRHDTHARFVVQALSARKHVFVEKPLCIHLKELTEIETQLAKSSVPHECAVSSLLMVGFNRRFAPQIKTIKTLLQANVAEGKSPKSFIMTVNAGEIPADHWTQNRDQGGGRIIGEVCHFIDLLRYLAGVPITKYHITVLDSLTIEHDKVSISLSFADGSFGIIHYLANGHASFPKERLEIFAQGQVLQLDNFRKLRGFGWRGFKGQNLWRQDKGQQNCVNAFVNAVAKGLPAPIPLDEILEVARITIEIADAIA